MFSGLTQPLMYAEALLAQIVNLSGSVDGAGLRMDFVRAVAELSGCELAQLYLLDATHTRLGISDEYLNGRVQARGTEHSAPDYGAQPLLQFALRQNRVVCLGALGGSLHDSAFLPAQPQPWQSLLCVPLVNQQQVVQGLLLCASSRHLDLQGLCASFGLLGSLVLGQLRLLQGARLPFRPVVSTQCAVPCTDTYGLIGKSPAMRQTRSLISKVLQSPYTVLLRGETGTGKEVVARAIHDSGPRCSKVFIVQNCAAFPESLLESELFGYRKGAFTGADRDRVGLFDAADGGTLLLDEIGDMPLSLQAKLLRVLEEGEIRPLGCNDTHTVDVRIIAATHRDLALLVSQGKFREDLYYRLAQFPIELPALRQRAGDVRELARHFASQACAFLLRDAVRWSDEALSYLAAYAFPGNVRELKGLVERAILLCEEGELLPEHFSLGVGIAPQVFSLNLRERMVQVERSLVLDSLRKNRGNQTRAARELGLPRRTLLYRLDRLNIRSGDCDA